MLRVQLEHIGRPFETQVVLMPAVPREGDAIAVNADDAAFRVYSVIWLVGGAAERADVIVRFR